MNMLKETAASFYRLLSAAAGGDVALNQSYDLLRHVFARVVDQAVQECRLSFVGFFSKVDYCIKAYGIPHAVALLVQQSRKELFPEYNCKADEEEGRMATAFPHHLKAVCFLVYYVCGKEEIPLALKEKFPRADRKHTWGGFERKVLRVVVERWDHRYIWATEEENGTVMQLCYGAENTTLTRGGTGSWDYLQDILREGAQLNLVRVRKQEGTDIWHPELIIYEPDFLINVTTIAGCFESYAESPYVQLVNKIKPLPNTKAIHLGNLAGQLLDDTVHDRHIPFEMRMQEYVQENALSMITCPDLITGQGYAQFVKEAAIQKEHIEQCINQTLPASVGGFSKKAVMLEPSFFSEVLGIQGRFDFLYEKEGRCLIIEQKSGKGEYVPYAAGTDEPVAKEMHAVQAILYRALYQYQFSRYAAGIHMMLLYSKYARGLLSIPPMPGLFLRAIRMRNLLAWCEMGYARDGFGILAKLTPDSLNRKHLSGRLWEQYVRPQLAALLAPLHNASELEVQYYLHFMRFVAREQLYAKLGTRMKENSGFASVWHDTLADKKAAGNIYDGLTVCHVGMNQSSVESVKLRFGQGQEVESSNFRVGDIVILYPYMEKAVPNACAQMVIRAGIEEMGKEEILLRLRNVQTDRRIFSTPDGVYWAIEHDLMDSLSGSLYASLHSFLSAPLPRRQLLLFQRTPRVDESIRPRGEYGTFNTLVTRAMQARDLFLIIGPPGTGKTSFGLVNLLREELLCPSASVLLLSYTNRAVDEICSKLVEMQAVDPQFTFVRRGSELSCAAPYRPFLLSMQSREVEGGNGVRSLISRTRVFCGTTASLQSHISLLQIKHFSLAIVDESSQILEHHLIGLLSAQREGTSAIDRFVFIGDHKQLPAVVQQPPEESRVDNPLLNAIHLTDCRLSLFERLLAQFRTDRGYDERFVYMLTRQGRMHTDIADFPNHAFYQHMLRPVPLPHQLQPSVGVQSSNGLLRMLTSHRIVFVASPPVRVSPSAKTNDVEARMIAATVYHIYLLHRDDFVAEGTVGVIVPYRNQISTVRHAIDRYGTDVLHHITIDTVERYQGSQRDYIIYGFTVHHRYQLNFLANNIFEEDGSPIDRKLNVAMTRARLHLILMGNPSLLSEIPVFDRLISYLRGKDSYLEMNAEQYCKGSF